jgi:hypothetical protein
MATPKKKAPLKRSAPKSAVKAPAPVPAKKKARLWIVPVVMVAVLLAVGTQIYLRARHLASLKFDMVRTGLIVAQGRDQGQAVGLVGIVGDKDDNAFVLEDDGAKPRIQRFDQGLSPQTLVYTAARPDQALVSPMDLDVDADGNVHVLLKDGRVLSLSNDLQYRSQFHSGLQAVSSLTVNSLGRVYVASAAENKVAFFSNGVREGEFGAPGTKSGDLAAPFRMRASAADEIMVVERIDTGLRAKVFRPDHSLRKTFLIDNLPVCEPIRLGINKQGIAFLNDHMGPRGLLAYDVQAGEFFGEAQATKDGQSSSRRAPPVRTASTIRSSCTPLSA